MQRGQTIYLSAFGSAALYLQRPKQEATYAMEKSMLGDNEGKSTTTLLDWQGATRAILSVWPTVLEWACV